MSKRPDDSRGLHVNERLGCAVFEVHYDSDAVVIASVRTAKKTDASELVTRQLRGLEVARCDLLRAAQDAGIKVVP
jgi:hypothetical protein